MSVSVETCPAFVRTLRISGARPCNDFFFALILTRTNARTTPVAVVNFHEL
jgi:hypothetical protein